MIIFLIKIYYISCFIKSVLQIKIQKKEIWHLKPCVNKNISFQFKIYMLFFICETYMPVKNKLY